MSTSLAQVGRGAVGPFALVGGLALGDRLVPGAIVIVDGRIEEVLLGSRSGNLPSTRYAAPIIAPGLIDLQVNGGFGQEVGVDPAAIAHLAARLPATGVTAFLPTMISSPAAAYPPLFAAFADFAAATNAAGASPLGLHLEGPFLSSARKGAHPLAAIEAADDHLFSVLLGESAVRLMTLAPERPGAPRRIASLCGRGVLVSLGHTDATTEEFLAGIEAGARMATHLFNAMTPFNHRAPGAVGAALTDDRVTIGLIADGVHAHPVALRLALRAKGPERVALVTDMMSAAGMPPGQYRLGPQTVTVDAGSARLADGTLAGSILTLDQAVRNLVAWLGIGSAVALRMATEVPARLLGLRSRGLLSRGHRADLTLWSDNLDLLATIIGGAFVHGNATSFAAPILPIFEES